MRVALITPPSTQLNTPYPATAYLRRFLATRGVLASQHDLGIELFHALFSRDGLDQVFDVVEASADDGIPDPAWLALAARDRHLSVVEGVVAFLRGKDLASATAWARPNSLPVGPRLAGAAKNRDRFGAMGVADLARYRCTLYLEDLADLITSVVDPGFGFSRYQHHLAVGPVQFDPIAERLDETSLPDFFLDHRVDTICADGVPDVVGITVPFPGTLYGALRVGRRLRERGAYVVLGGGYVSTELRSVDEARLWTCTDALVYDDGEGPLDAILAHLSGDGDRRHRTRTAGGLHDRTPARVPFTSAASYEGLDLAPYLGVVDSLSPAHRLWSDGRWNKVTLAHGCYWKRCAFCDVNLDYIAHYEPAHIVELVDHMAELVHETGVSGFHLVDEAAPPRLLRDLALELLDRDLSVSFWGNIRFESAFSPDLCALLAAAGMVAVTGGLEVASDRLLKVMDKGITVEQAARAASAFQSAGVMVHAYLMYGFPTQTDAETVDSMEVVRQLFAAGLLDSAFWHRFVLTRHSRVFAEPDRYHVAFELPSGPVFATNDLPHHDPGGGDHDRFDEPLARSLMAWMAGRDVDRPVQSWFDTPVPEPASEPDRVVRALATSARAPKTGQRVVWLGSGWLDGGDHTVLLDRAGAPHPVYGSEGAREWLQEVVEAARPGGEAVRFGDVREVFPGSVGAFSRMWAVARAAGLVAV